MKKVNRTLSILLALVMLVGLLPVGALAEGEASGGTPPGIEGPGDNTGSTSFVEPPPSNLPVNPNAPQAGSGEGDVDGGSGLPGQGEGGNQPPVTTCTVSIAEVDSALAKVSGAGTYDCGKTATVRFAFNEGRTGAFSGWFVNNVKVADDMEYTFPVTEDVTLTPKYMVGNDTIGVLLPGGGGKDGKPDLPGHGGNNNDDGPAIYTVAVSADPTTGGTVAGGGTVMAGESVTVIATAKEGYYFTGWYDESEDPIFPVNTEAEYTFFVTADIALTAKFANMVDCKVFFANNSNYADFTPGANDKPNGYYVQLYRLPTEPNLQFKLPKNTRFTPKEDCDFLGWKYGNDETLYRPGDTITLTNKYVLGQNEGCGTIFAIFGRRQTYTMHFAAEDKDSTYNEMDSGMIRTSMASMTLKEDRAGAGVSFTLPEPGFEFTEDGWTFFAYKLYSNYYQPGAVIGSDQANGQVIWVYANYTKLPAHRITVTADPAEGGTVIGGRTVQPNESASVTATPKEGWHFAGWYKGGTLVSAAEEYTFTVTENITLTAKFEEHTWKDATCTDPKTCTECGATAGDPTGHSYMWEPVDDENHKGTCNKCGGEITEKHSYQEGRCIVCNGPCGHSSPNASYSHDPDIHWQTCAYCGNVIEHEEHTWQAAWMADETQHWHECTVCHRKKDEAAHSWSDWTPVDGSSTHKRVCSECGAETTEAHIWSDWKTTIEPEIGKPGERQHTCFSCGKAETEPIAALIGYTVTVAADPSEGGTVTGGGTVKEGQSVTVTATANTGYGFVSWMEGESKVSTNASYTFTVTGERHLVAVFQPMKYTVTYTIVNGTWDGSSNASIAEYVEYGRSPVQIPTGMEPDEGYEGGAWSPDPNGATITDAASFTYTFTAKQYVVQDSEGNTVQAVTWQKGSGTALDLTIHRSKDDDLTFGLFVSLENDGNTVGSESYESAVGSLKLSIRPKYLETLSAGDHTLKVNFRDGSATLKLTVQPSPVGTTHTVTVQADPAEGGTATGGGTYAPGTEVTVTATASEGYAFAGWWDDADNDVSWDEEYTIASVTGDMALTAKFIKMWTVTMDMNGGTIMDGASETMKSSVSMDFEDGHEEQLPDKDAMEQWIADGSWIAGPANGEYIGAEIADANGTKTYQPGDMYKVISDATIKVLWKSTVTSPSPTTSTPTPTATPEPTPTVTPEPTPTATPEPTPTPTPATVSLTVKKVWNDSNDAARKRSKVEANIILRKTVNGVSTEVDVIEVGYTKNWTYTWEDLPAYEDGAAVTYSVKEELVKAKGYRSDTTAWKTVADGETVTIKNTYRDPDAAPGTGDSRKTLLWAGLMLASALSCGAALLAAKKRKEA